jgi:hypothetical protein
MIILIINLAYDPVCITCGAMADEPEMIEGRFE